MRTSQDEDGRRQKAHDRLITHLPTECLTVACRRRTDQESNLSRTPAKLLPSQHLSASLSCVHTSMTWVDNNKPPENPYLLAHPATSGLGGEILLVCYCTTPRTTHHAPRTTNPPSIFQPVPPFLSLLQRRSPSRSHAATRFRSSHHCLSSTLRSFPEPLSTLSTARAQTRRSPKDDRTSTRPPRCHLLLLTSPRTRQTSPLRTLVSFTQRLMPSTALFTKTAATTSVRAASPRHHHLYTAFVPTRSLAKDTSHRPATSA